jgi:hypothetical protein
MSVVIVLGAMWVHLVNGPFRAENLFTMDVVFPGLTAWADGSGLSGRSRHVPKRWVWADRGGPLGRKSPDQPRIGFATADP